MIEAGPVSLYRFPHQVSLGIELDSFFEAGLHVLSPRSLSFDSKIISKASLNNRGNDEYEIG